MFLALFGVLSLLALSLTVLLDYREYSSTVTQIQNDMIRYSNFVDNVWAKLTRPDANNYGSDSDSDDLQEDWMDNYSALMNMPTYTFLINRSGEIYQNIYSKSDEENASQYNPLAEKIVERSKPGTMEIGNLFTHDYAWYYPNSMSLTIADISSIRMQMLGSLLISAIVFLLFELIFFFVCRKATDWMIQPIEATFDKQKQFIADASHELKTPVAVILANAEAMERDPETKWLKNIENEADRMNGLITDLLDLTKSEQKAPVLEDVDFSRLIEKQCLIQEAVIFEKNLELQENVEPDLYVKGQASTLTQVFAILLDNAIAHSSHLVKVDVFKKGKDVYLEVSNTGIPIPPEEREKIFERFYRADDSRNRSSHRYGLGLAIAKNIVTNLDGTISADSRDGLTVFTVKLRAVTPSSSN